MSLVIGGLRRLLSAPGLWLGTWVGLMLIAGLVGLQARLVVASAVGPFDALDRSRVLFGLIDALRLHPAAGTGLLTAVLGGTLASATAWTVLSPVVITRLASRRSASELGGRALATLPGVLVQSLWHGLLRIVLMLAVVMAAWPLPTAGLWIVTVVTWLGAGVALDATRVAVVEHEAGPWHPRAAWRGFHRVVRRPRLLLPGVLLGLGQLALSGAILWLALAGLGDGSPWVPRLLALVSVGLGLWRIGIVVEDAAADS